MNFSRVLTAAALCAAFAFAQPPAARFDYQVRNDYFAGFGGDAEALQRALGKTGDTLAADPNHAEAMVWHGAGLFFQAGQAFREGDRQKGMQLFGKGQGMMDRAVQLAPDNVGVRVPRGAVLLQASLNMPPEVAKPLVEKGLADYLHTHEMQKDQMASLGTHPQGELLFGIADAYRRLGNDDKAAEWFGMIAKMLPDTNYAKRAGVWLTTRTLTPAQARCVGCHTAGK